MPKRLPDDPVPSRSRRLLVVVVPVYDNAGSLPQLLLELAGVAAQAESQFSVQVRAVFVVDGSPDDSLAVLRRSLPGVRLESTLIEHSRNFGSFAAIRTGLAATPADWYCTLAADLQEPPDLVLDFLRALVEGTDVAVGTRVSRADAAGTRWTSGLFWRVYRRLVNREIPRGGVDTFGCTREVRDELVALSEANSSLVAQLYWIGFRRVEVPYTRLRRPHGRSAWSFRRRVRYLLDSVFAFTDLPISLLLAVGGFGILAATVLGVVTFVARVFGGITVPGYAALALIITFFGALNLFGLGLVGQYAWRGFENTKGRPGAITRSREEYPPSPAPIGGRRAPSQPSEEAG